MSKSAGITLGIITLILVGGGIYTYLHVAEQKDLEVNEARRVLTTEDNTQPYTDLAGTPIALDEYLGQILVVNSWASWCPSCRTELPMIDEVASELPEGEITVLGINRGETKEEVERYMRALGDISEVRLILDPNDRYYQSVDGFAMPETIIYDQTGRKVFHKRGTITRDELTAEIAAVLDSN